MHDIPISAYENAPQWHDPACGILPNRAMPCPNPWRTDLRICAKRTRGAPKDAPCNSS